MNNNKGFSLVELIVVILIIAILAVALAPQIIRYVTQSRSAADANNAASLKSTVQSCIAEYIGKGGSISDDITITGSPDAVAKASDTSPNPSAVSGRVSSLGDLIAKSIGKYPVISDKDKTGGSWVITVSDNGSSVSVAGYD